MHRHTYIGSCIQAHSYNYCSYTFFSYNQSRVSFIHTHTYMHSWWCWHILRMAFKHCPLTNVAVLSTRILNVFKFKCSIQWLQHLCIAHTCFLYLIHVGYAWLCVTLFHANKNENFHSSSPVRVFYHLNQVGNNKFWRDKF